MGTEDVDIARELAQDVNADFDELLLPTMFGVRDDDVPVVRIGSIVLVLTAATSAAISSAKTLPKIALVTDGKL
jgi:hypothetical protein